MRMLLSLIAVAATLLACGSATAADPVPVGHPDFYPSSERTIGWRGDRTGAFPGATPVTKWWEGTPVEGTITNWGGSVLRGKQWILADRKSKNIAWKVRMPGHSNSQPIVIGDRVITTAEPSSLVCVDIAIGKILWVRENNPFEIMGLPKKEVRHLTRYVERVDCVIALARSLVGNYTALKGPVEEKRDLWKQHLLWSDQVLLDMNRGPYAEHVQESLRKMDGLFSELEMLSPGDNPDTFGKRMVAPGGLAAPWIYQKYKFYPAAHWSGWCGWTFPTPVTDGEFICTDMGQGQVVCYDLNGDRVWARFLPRTDKRGVGTPGTVMGIANIGSPLLVGDTLLVTMPTLVDGNTHGLFALDKRTGKTLWTAPPEVPAGVPSVAHLSIPLPDGKVLDAVACVGGAKRGPDKDMGGKPNGYVVRLSDGKILETVDVYRGHNVSGGSRSDLVVGNRWYFNHGAGLNAYEFTAKNSDEIEMKLLWQEKIGRASWSCTGVAYGDYLYRFVKDRDIVRAADGTGISSMDIKGAHFTAKISYPSPILAGKYFIALATTGRRNRSANPVLSQVLELVAPGQTKLIAENNVLDGNPYATMPQYEKHIRGYKPGDILSRDGAAPTQFGYSSPFAEGNRFFVRSVSHLYCIGDPNEPYNWNPASRPERIAKGLKKPEEIPVRLQDNADTEPAEPPAWEKKVVAVKSSPAKLVKLVADDNRWTALAALDALAKQGDTRSDLVPKLAANGLGSDKDPRVVLRTTALLAEMPEPKRAADALIGVLDHKDIRCVVAAVDALQRMDNATTHRLVQQLLKRLKSAAGPSALPYVRAFGRLGKTFEHKGLLVEISGALSKVLGSKHSAKLQKEACWALAEYGKKAKFAVPALKTAAMSKDCPKAAKEALSKIAPGTSLNPMDMESDDALGLDDLL